MRPPVAAVLLLEDNELDAARVRERLDLAGLPVAVERVSGRDDFVARLQERPYDLILSDYELPALEGLASLELAREHQPEAAFVFVSGTPGEERAVEALKRGATDYVMKQRLSALPAAVARALDEACARRAQKAAAAALQEREAEYRTLFEAAAAGSAEVELPTGQLIRVNQKFCEMTGYTREELTRGMTLADLTHPDDRADHQAAVERLERGEIPEYQFEKRYVRKDGTLLWVHVTDSVVRRAAGRPARLLAVVQDITARKRAEERLRLLYAVGEATRSAVDPRDVMTATTRLLGEHLKATRCAYAGVEPDNDQFTIHEDWAAHGAPSSAGTYSLDRFGPRAAADMRAGRTLVVRDMDREVAPSEGANMFNALGIKAIVCCPLVKGGRLVAMMAVHQAAPRDWLPEEITTVEEVVERSWAHIERVRAEVERTRFALLAENAHDFVGIAGPDLSPLYVNQAGMALVGLDSADEFRATKVLDFFFPEDHPTIRDEFLPRVAREGAAEIEVRFRHFKTGEPIWMTYGVVALRDTSGRLTGFATVSRNITARRRAEEALKEADRRKDEFLAILAHELRNPLAPIRTGLQTLKRVPADGPEAERTLAIMERQLAHMVRLIDDLLDVSRITRGKIDLRKERIDLETVIENAVEASRPLIEAGRHQLSVALPDEPLWLDADLTRLAQVVSNLINNAAKYTPDGGRIDVSVRREEREALVVVKDSGVGISGEMLPRVFEMFAQANRTLERAHGGLGIGLTLVHRLVEMHGGTVQVESEGPNRGSTFTARLPLLDAPAPARAEAPENGRAEAKVAGKRVLVVDDNRDGAETLALLLEIFGHDTQIAYDGPGALEAVQTFRPDVAFLDIGLPGFSGYEVARRLREDPALRSTVLVALTGWGAEEYRQKSREAGFDFHLTKPVEAAQVNAILSRVAGLGGE
ncbi:PAS domain S-box protein [Sorangium sp. So ce131]|uniref:PAS domain S-box protein n=1 Tax=Sorangium sp. So ce131 TaxID=3133282 RepID=UPI003F609FAD